jgi:hypothetical protein
VYFANYKMINRKTAGPINLSGSQAAPHNTLNIVGFQLLVRYTSSRAKSRVNEMYRGEVHK